MQVRQDSVQPAKGEIFPDIFLAKELHGAAQFFGVAAQDAGKERRRVDGLLRSIQRHIGVPVHQGTGRAAGKDVEKSADGLLIRLAETQREGQQLANAQM